jgi:adenine C2-methylase RlmN of 23S rRNA A2503 and tRNA A37
MVKARKLSPLPILDEQSLLGFLRERGVKDVHATTIWNHIVNQRPQSIRDINIDIRSALPSGLIEALEPYFAITTSKVVTKDVASDGTTKLLVELQDGQRVSVDNMAIGDFTAVYIIPA